MYNRLTGFFSIVIFWAVPVFAQKPGSPGPAKIFAAKKMPAFFFSCRKFSAPPFSNFLRFILQPDPTWNQRIHPLKEDTIMLIHTINTVTEEKIPAPATPSPLPFT